MRVAVVRFPGSNCDFDSFDSAERAGAAPWYVWHRETSLAGADAVILPGGFSYGDYLRSGAIARFSPIMAAVQRFARDGGPVLGICNGFQILCEAGMLPGALMRNAQLTFVSRPVWLRVEQTDTPVHRRLRGRPGPPDAGGPRRGPLRGGRAGPLASWKPPAGSWCATSRRTAAMPGAANNPNGSMRDIAGICNAGRQRGRAHAPPRPGDRSRAGTERRDWDSLRRW